MVVLVTCNNEEDPIKNEGARVLTSLEFDFSALKGSIFQNNYMEGSGSATIK